MRTRVRRHLDVLAQEEAAVRVALRDAPDEVEEKLAQLRARIEIAEHSLAADASDGWSAFAAAVEAELERWDAYIERLQTSVVDKAWKAREQAEVAIGDVRSRRIEVDERLAQAHDTATGYGRAGAGHSGSRPARATSRRTVGEADLERSEVPPRSLRDDRARRALRGRADAQRRPGEAAADVASPEDRQQETAAAVTPRGT